MKINALLLTGAALLIATGAQAQSAPNLVSNGSFETGDLTGWNSNGWFVINSGYAGNPAADGSFFATTGCVQQYCTLSQDIATTAGQSYSLSFVFNPGPGADFGQGDTQVYFGGTQLIDLNGGAQANTPYTFNVTALGSTSTLLFTGYQNPSYNEVDGVSLAATGAVPEPATWAMMLVGFGMVGFGLRRRAKQAVRVTYA